MAQGKAAQKILNEPQKRNIIPTKMTGMGSDGANITSGEGIGVNRRLKEQNAHMVLLVQIYMYLSTLMAQTFYK